MPTLTLSHPPFGKVVGIWGKATLRTVDGHERQLNVGDTVHDGDQVLTSQNGIVKIDSGDGQAATDFTSAVPLPQPEGAQGSSDLDRTIAALNQPSSDAATAAGLTGGDAGDLSPGLRVDRISEATTPAALVLPDAPVATVPQDVVGIVPPSSLNQLAPTVGLAQTPASDTGASSSDGLTDNTRPVVVGTGHPSSTVVVTITTATGAPVTYTTTTDANGKYTIDLGSATPTSGALPAGGLPEGAITLTSTSPDNDGNPVTATGGFIVDVTPPATSIDLAHTPASDTGTSATDGLTDNTKPVLTGTGEPSSTVLVTVTPASGAPLTYTATTDATGKWTIDLASAAPTSGTLPAGGLPDGHVALAVSSTDAAGNTATAAGAFTVDHTAPLASIDLAHTPASDTGASSTDGLTDNTKPVLTGTGEPSSIVLVTVTPATGSPLTYSATTDATGKWTIDLSSAAPTSGMLPVAGLPDGHVALAVASTDAAGNVTTATGAFSVDHTAPVASIDLAHTPASDTGASSVDGLTDNTKPVLTGTGEPSSTVLVTVTSASGSPLTYSATTDATGKWSIDLSAATPTSGVLPAGGLPDGHVGLSVSSADAAGNVATATGAFVEDHTAPVASIDLAHTPTSDTGASATDGLTNNTKPVLTGTGEPSSTVFVTVSPASGPALTYSATTDASGKWAVDISTATPTSGALPAAGLPNGQVALTVSSADAAGNVATAAGAFTVDHTVAASIDLAHTPASDTGASSTDGLTDNTKPMLVGTGEPNSTVLVTVTPATGSPLTYAATTDAFGKWTVDLGSAAPTSGTLPATGLPDGHVALAVSSTDIAGNVVTAAGAFTVDHTAPVASIDLAHTPASDTGASATDGLTDNTKPVLTGTGEPSSTVFVTVTPASGSALMYTATTDATGKWTVDLSSAAPTSGALPAAGLPDGHVALTVSSTDAAGNVATAAGAFTVDHTAPVASIDLAHTAASDTGASATDGLTDNTKPVLTGTGEPSSTVLVTVTPASGSPLTYTATTDATGKWTVDLSSAAPTSGTLPVAGLPDGHVALTVSSTDAAGNVATAAGAFTVDHTAPLASIDLAHTPTSDTGASATDGLTDNTKPVLTGTGEPSSTVLVTVTPASGSPLTYTATTDATGKWTIDLSSAAPTSGTLPVAGLPDGHVALAVSSTDAAGNVATAAGAFTVDHTAPVASIDLAHTAASDTGVSATDGLTDNTKPVLTGTGEPSSTVLVTVTPASGSPLTYTASTDATGKWTINLSTAAPTSGTLPVAGLPDGHVALAVSSTDAAGNVATAAGAFTVDHTAPIASIDLAHTAASDTGVSATDGLTDNTKPVLTGTGEPSSTVLVTVTPLIGATLTYNATTDATGKWTLDLSSATPASGSLPSTGLPDGHVGLTVSSTDAAGNVATATGAFIEDHTAPIAAISLAHTPASDTGTSSSDNLTDNGKPVLLGTGEPNTTVLITVTPASGPALTYTAATDATGRWTLDLSSTPPTSGTLPAAGLPDGPVGLSVTSTDAAGNVATATGAFTEDQTAPPATIGLAHTAASDTGVSATDSLTDNTRPVVTGTGEASSTVFVTITPATGAVLNYTTTTDATGKWSIDLSSATPTSGSLPAAGLPDGQVLLVVSVKDAAGNVAASTGAFTVDHTPPVATIDLAHTAASDTGSSATDGLTANVEPVLTGKGEPSSTVHVTVTDAAHNVLTYDATTDASGNWNVDVSTATPTSGVLGQNGLADGVVSLTVVSTDPAGNSATGTGAFTIDHAATPTIAVTAEGRWIFNETAGATTVNQYNVQTGTLSDINPTLGGNVAPTWVAGHASNSGTALNFDGQGSYVALSHATTEPLTETATLSAWIKTTQTGSTVGWADPSLIGSEQIGTGQDIQWGAINSAGQIGLGIGNVTGLYSTQAINDNNWHNVVITRDLNETTGVSTVSIYIDGTLSNSGTIAQEYSLPNGVVPNEFGGFGYTNAWLTPTSDGTSGDVYYKGAMDDARIYDHALTADQAKAVYLVENGYETTAVANDGEAVKLNMAASNYTQLTLTGLEHGMTITDGVHSITSTDSTAPIDITGWAMNSLEVTNVGTGASATLQFDAYNTVNGQTHDATTYLSLVSGTTLLGGTAGNDTLTATDGATLLSGGAGDDILTGGAGNDMLLGGAGNDHLSGGAGNDILIGGQGNDTLTGGAGNDVFKWNLGDGGTKGAPAVDTVTDFSSTPGNTDTLDLRDLLVGATHVGTDPGNLGNYLHFDHVGADTVIEVSSTGAFSTGYTAAAADQTIILKGVDLTIGGSLSNDHQILNDLLKKGELHTG